MASSLSIKPAKKKDKKDKKARKADELAGPNSFADLLRRRRLLIEHGNPDGGKVFRNRNK